MKPKLPSRVVVTVLAVLLACTQAQARTLDQVPPYLKDEGNFVAYPAIAGAGLGMVIGELIALPATIIAAPIGWAAGDPLGYTLLPGSVLATGGAEAGYHLFGALPWALKNGFYDAPMNAVARIKGEPASGLVAQVEPAPAFRGDQQYLDTTPVDARVPVVLARHYSSALPPPKPLTSLMLRRQLSPFKPPPMPGRKPVAADMAKASPAPTMPATAPLPQAALPVPALPAPVAVPAPTPVEAAPVQPPPAQVAVTPPPAPAPAAPAVTRPNRAAPAEPAVPSSVDAPAADAPQAGGDDAGSRPALKKKRKFSERFSF